VTFDHKGSQLRVKRPLLRPGDWPYIKPREILRPKRKVEREEVSLKDVQFVRKDFVKELREEVEQAEQRSKSVTKGRAMIFNKHNFANELKKGMKPRAGVQVVDLEDDGVSMYGFNNQTSNIDLGSAKQLETLQDKYQSNAVEKTFETNSVFSFSSSKFPEIKLNSTEALSIIFDEQ